MTSSWGHYENLARFIKDKNALNGSVGPIFNAMSFFTEKLDGSNLAIWIKDGNIHALLGRKSIVWDTSNPKSLKSLSYGNADALGSLPEAMASFAIAIATELCVSEIIIFGEAFRYKKGKGQKFASWHPFGYKLPNESEWHAYRLNSLVYNLFAKFTKIPKAAYDDHESLFAFLQNANDHVICPPPVMFAGVLGEGIFKLYDLMKNITTDEFEGVFVILEDNSAGFKWKTGIHEEQMAIAPIESLVFDTDDDRSCYQKIADVFNTRPNRDNRIKMLRSRDAEDAKLNQKLTKEEIEAIIKRDISTALVREYTKMVPVDSIPKKDRKLIVEKMSLGVIDEVKQIYNESDKEIPYSDEMLKNISDHMTMIFLMQIVYVVPTPVNAQ
jgi:hypothetical protein